MKYKFQHALIWSLMATLVLLLWPPGVWAAEKPTVTLEQAIKTVKQHFTVPTDAANFSSGFHSYNERQCWSLNWNNPKGPGSSMSAEVDAVTGEILNVHLWQDKSPEQEQNSLISREEALDIAQKLLSSLISDKLKELQPVQEANKVIPLTSRGLDSYTFRWQRVVNQIPFPQDSITVTVSTRDKLVTDYRYQWTTAKFPDASKVISPARAAQVFHSSGMLKLQYTSVSDTPIKPVSPNQAGKQVLLVYCLDHPSNGVINALTGKPVDLRDDIRLLNTDMIGAGGYSEKSQALVELSPQELEETQATAKLITREQAEAAVKKWVDIPAGLTINSASLTVDQNTPGTRAWRLSWQNSSNKPETGTLQYCSARVDASTGELVGLNLQYNQEPAQKTNTINRSTAQKLAEDFLTKVQPERLKQVRLKENDLRNETDQTYQSFNYRRVVNSLIFPANGMSVTVDCTTGHITNYNLNWANLEFPPAAQAMPLAKAEESFLSYRPMTLNYVQIESQEGAEEVILVYLPTAPNGIPVSNTIDAKTGQPLDWQGKPIDISPSAYCFDDIEGNFAAEEIKLLGQAGIFGEYGNAFHPDKKITAVSLLRAMLMVANGVDSIRDLSDTEIMERAKQQGWLVKGEELQPQDTISEETMYKLLIRFLDLDRAALLKGIYHLPFKPATPVPPESQGYIALAWGLGILDNDPDFHPAEPVNRARAAVALVRAAKAIQ